MSEKCHLQRCQQLISQAVGFLPRSSKSTSRYQYHVHTDITCQLLPFSASICLGFLVIDYLLTGNPLLNNVAVCPSVHILYIQGLLGILLDSCNMLQRHYVRMFLTLHSLILVDMLQWGVNLCQQCNLISTDQKLQHLLLFRCFLFVSYGNAQPCWQNIEVFLSHVSLSLSLHVLLSSDLFQVLSTFLLHEPDVVLNGLRSSFIQGKAEENLETCLNTESFARRIRSSFFY